jgi:hypothetical protein
MSNQTKTPDAMVLVPVLATKAISDALAALFTKGFLDDSMVQGILTAVTSAALSEQPSALGGEPEVMRVITDKPCPVLRREHSTLKLHAGDRCTWCEGTDFVVEYVEQTPALDRAHLAPLQAELKSAIADKEAYGQNAIDLRKQVDQLKARCDELQILLACRDDDMKSASAEFDGIVHLLRCALPLVQARCDETDYGDASARTTREGILSVLKRLYPPTPAGSEKV